MMADPLIAGLGEGFPRGHLLARDVFFTRTLPHKWALIKTIGALGQQVCANIFQIPELQTVAYLDIAASAIPHSPKYDRSLWIV